MTGNTVSYPLGITIQGAVKYENNHNIMWYRA